MNDLFRRSLLGLAFSLCLVFALQSAASPPQNGDVLLSAMQQELQRAHDNLGKLDPAPYFLSYSVYDQNEVFAVGSQGSLLTSARARRRSADVIVRVGSPALDNAHEQNRHSAIDSGTLPLADDRNALAYTLWRLTYEEYRKAASSIILISFASL